MTRQIDCDRCGRMWHRWERFGLRVPPHLCRPTEVRYSSLIGATRWLPRWFHHLYALVGGYFWLPCPECGRHWGGHEWADNATVWMSGGKGYGICTDCAQRRGLL